MEARCYATPPPFAARELPATLQAPEVNAVNDRTGGDRQREEVVGRQRWRRARGAYAARRRQACYQPVRALAERNSMPA